ncbi:hypothetical protein ONZ45_g6663 [Pleurotus djamor]|nr:hypothetical protein ONZ45_g6663 [Pleurotus djamor]
MAEVTQHQWDEELGRLMQLSISTLKRSHELESCVAHLRRELSLWQSVHASLREAAEYATTTHDVALLQRQLYSTPLNTPYLKETRSLVLCIVDGSTAFFKESLVAQGFQGGQAAAQDLTRVIAGHLTGEGVQITTNTISFWTTIFINKASLLADLLSEDACTDNQFAEFLSGFSHASTRFAIVDVGSVENSTESKIRGTPGIVPRFISAVEIDLKPEHLETYTRFPQTLRIFVAGSLKNCLDTVRSLEVEQLLWKVISLTGNEDGLRLPLVSLPPTELADLFRARIRRPPPKKPSPLSVTTSLTVSTNGGLISPKSPLRSARLIDPNLPLHKQNPPPCNEFYLMNCSKGPASCKYSHDYLLTPDQLACLANNAKKAPCNWLKNGMQCPYGEKCCWGHVCPNGPKCFHLSKGKCWFKGAALHTPPSEA